MKQVKFIVCISYASGVTTMNTIYLLCEVSASYLMPESVAQPCKYTLGKTSMINCSISCINNAGFIHSKVVQCLYIIRRYNKNGKKNNCVFIKASVPVWEGSLSAQHKIRGYFIAAGFQNTAKASEAMGWVFFFCKSIFLLLHMVFIQLLLGSAEHIS